jgi:hypothetical protein
MLLSQEARVSPSPSFFLGETLRDVRVEGSTSWILVIVMGGKKLRLLQYIGSCQNGKIIAQVHEKEGIITLRFLG